MKFIIKKIKYTIEEFGYSRIEFQVYHENNIQIPFCTFTDYSSLKEWIRNINNYNRKILNMKVCWQDPLKISNIIHDLEKQKEIIIDI